MATGWSQAQVDWLKANDPARLAGGYKSHYKGQGTLQGGGTPAQGNKLQMQPAGKSGGGGLLQGRIGGAQQAFQADAPRMQKHGMGTILGGGLLGGAGAAAGMIGMGGLGWGGGKVAGSALLGKALGASAAFGPAGWAVGGGLLAAGLLANKKSNKQFEGTIDTGGAGGFKAQGGQMAQVSEGYVPTEDEFVQHGRWLMPQDSYAHDYGRTFGESDRKYYANFKSAVENARNPAERRAILQAHGFDSPAQKKEAPKSKRRAAPPVEESAPAPATKASVSKPASGLEDTIKTKPEEIKRTYMRPGKKRKAGFFSYGGEMA